MQQLPNDACNDRYSPSFKRHARQHIEQDSAEKRPARDVRQIDKLENAGNKARRRDEHEEVEGAEAREGQNKPTYERSTD